MSKEIIWSLKARNELIDILEYWIERNGSNNFSSKLHTLINENLELLLRFPEIGKETDITHVRVRPIQNYLLYYIFDDSSLYVLTIRHQKRDSDTATIA